MRINKFLAVGLGLSRRQADKLIASNEVIINGRPAHFGDKVMSSDKVIYKGEQVAMAELTYYMLNKPFGYVCSRRQQDNKPTIYELLPAEMKSLKTAGRLDSNSTGLVILTNDGDFIHQLIHPSFKKEKVYIVATDKELDKRLIDKLQEGVELDDGLSSLQLTALGIKTYQVSIHEGRNRQIRRTFEAIDRKILRLHRIRFGPYHLNNLKVGEFKAISKVEI